MSKGKEVAQAVSGLCNSYGSEERKVFIEEMSHDHRSLQQAFTRLCVDWLKKVATQSHDGRNIASVMLAKELEPILEKHPLPFI
jgi:hypothetical protein